jgi:AcrR family transcriptional regulator
MPRRIDEEALFLVTLEVLAEEGYDGMTTAEIAHRAGVNEATLFRRYGSKVGLVRAAIAQALSSTPFASLPSTDDVEADLRSLIQAFGATTSTLGGAVTALLTAASRHPDLRSSAAPLLANLTKATEVLARHQRQGSLKREDPWVQLVLLISPLMAAGLWERSALGPAMHLDPDDVVAGFLRGHGGPGGAAP